MLWVCDNIGNYEQFKIVFREMHSNNTWIDISKLPSQQLVEQSESIISHHSNACIFLGYLEPGWMLEPTHQTLLRTLFRKFDVGFICKFVDGIPFSWKNEIEVLYS
jgi:hypothetical protein